MPAKPVDAQHQTLSVGDHPEIFLHTRNGNLQVVTGDGNDIQLDIFKEGPSKQRADAVKITVKNDDGRVTIDAEFPVNRGWFGVTTPDETYTQGDQQVKVHFALIVPRGARLGSAATPCGNIELRGLTGAVHAHTGSGSITAKAIDGLARLNTTNGNISAELVNVNGSSTLDTRNGAVEVWLPAAVNANLRIQAANGNVSNDFPGASVTGRVRDIQWVTLGAGGPEIYLFNSNGPITVHRIPPPAKPAPPHRKKTSTENKK